MMSYIQNKLESPVLLIVIPTLNEEKYIEQALNSLIHQYHDFLYTIVVADGGSTDQTLEKVKSIQTLNKNVHIVENSKVIQSAGINTVAKMDIPGNILLRADAHAHYPPDFISECVQALYATDAVSVVVPMRTVGITPVQKCIAVAQNSWLGTGGSSHRNKNSKSGYVEHGHHAAVWRSCFLSLGGYDETFSHNEDAEFDWRLIKEKRLIWMCNKAMIDYFPRETYLALSRQYYRHGSGRAKTIISHRVRPKLRQIIPLIFVLGSILSILFMLFFPIIVIFPICYLFVYLTFSIAVAIRSQDLSLLGVGVAAATMHMSWSIGFISEIKKVFLARIKLSFSV